MWEAVLDVVLPADQHFIKALFCHKIYHFTFDALLKELLECFSVLIGQNILKFDLRRRIFFSFNRRWLVFLNLKVSEYDLLKQGHLF